MSTKIAELEEKLLKQREERKKLEEAQYEKDLEARIELESEHGAIAHVKVARFIEGQPTHAYVRVPTAAEYKRYKAQVGKSYDRKAGSSSRQEAGELLARACWVYPPPPAQKGEEDRQEAMIEAFPGLLSAITVVATALAEGDAEEMGKG